MSKPPKLFMTNISLDLSNKIPKQTIEILQKVKNISEKLNIPIFLIGATARELVLQYGYNLPKTTTTRDIDFGVAVNDWMEYEKLKQELIKTDNFLQDLKAEHRLIEKTSQTKIDFVPFGKIESPLGQIVFRNETTMNMTGFAEVYASALLVKLSSDLTIKIISPIGLALLKIFAWNDRFENKDISDFWLITKNYLDIADNQDRIYNQHFNLLEDENYDHRIAGAKLLGVDLGKISSEKTKHLLLEFFENNKRIERFAFVIMQVEKDVEDNFERIMQILKSVKEGLNETF